MKEQQTLYLHIAIRGEIRRLVSGFNVTVSAAHRQYIFRFAYLEAFITDLELRGSHK